MHIKINGKIHIIAPDDKIRKWLRENYIIPNPEYKKRLMLNLWLGNTPKTIPLYSVNEASGCITLPYGCIREVLKYLVDNYDDPYAIPINVELNKDKTANWKGYSYTLRDYQEKCVEHMLKRKIGIIKAPCSSGKTIMAHELAKRTGMKTLWITHTRDLLMQSLKVGAAMVGAKNVGTITNGKMNIGNVITYATIQTLGKFHNTEYRHLFNCVIVDECHRCSTKSEATLMSKVINNIDAEYKYGLSATPETFDGYGRTILCNLGNIEWIIDKDELIEDNRIINVQIVPVFTNWIYPDEAYDAAGVLNWKKAIKAMSKNEARCELIVSLLHNKPTLILADTIDMLIGIANKLSKKEAEKACLVCTKHDESKIEGNGKFVHRSHLLKERQKYIDNMISGEFKYMLSTYSLAKEGLNIPRIEQVIFAYPAVNPNIITQSIGRAARTSNGKTKAVVFDLVDKPNYFQKLYKQRLKLYKQEDNQIININDWT